MEFQYETKTGSLRIFTPKEIDECAASEMREEADMLIDNYQIRHLIFDFSNTEFMDSSGIGMMMGRYRAVQRNGGHMRAEHVNDRVKKILDMAGIGKLIEISKA